MWYVYFLELSNAAIYVGSTPDLKRRFESHQKGQVQSTKAFVPMKLKSYVAVENVNFDVYNLFLPFDSDIN